MKWLYETNNDNTHRYVLGNIKDGEESKPLICFGINPSTATPQALDNTIKSVERLTTANGFNGWIMLNIYPQRSTDPKGIHKVLDENAHLANLEKIEKIFMDHKPVIWAAWGTSIERRKYLKNCLQDIIKLSKKYDCEWISLGRISNAGHPHHPLYLSKDTKYDSFDIDNYMENLK